MNTQTLIIISIVIVLLVLTFVISSNKNTSSKAVKTNNMNRIAVFETNQGTFKVEMYEDKAPMTTKNFIDLVEHGFYDGTRFHRVIAKFMIQGGDPLSKDVSQKDRWGTGGPGYAIKDEFVGLKNDKGTISMANSGPNTGGSQFFINVADNTFLDGKHAVFGNVVEGYDTVEKISKTATDSSDNPVNDVIINRIIVG